VEELKSRGWHQAGKYYMRLKRKTGINRILKACWPLGGRKYQKNGQKLLSTNFTLSL
jgi:hypothetical protein